MFEIKKIPVTPLEQNCRVAHDTSSTYASVIDPGGDVAKILSYLRDSNLTCNQILLTHSHFDHCGGVAELKKIFPEAKLFSSTLESEYRSNVAKIGQMYGLSEGFENCPEPEKFLSEGANFSIGQYQFSVIETPGHSPGSLTFYNVAEQVAFVGDVLFQGSIGRSDLPGGNQEVLFDSIKKLISLLPGHTKILSGHGLDTTLDVEIKDNPFLKNI
jgi:hydroxyacylglutathione hydrolase